MNKNLQLLLYFLLTNSLLLGQPVIQDDILFSPGDSASVRIGQGFWQPGQSGQNASWDFSGLSGGTDWTWIALDPDTMAHRDSFPEANVAFRFPANDTTESIVFYRSKPDTLEYHGAASLSAGNSDNVFYQLLDRQPDLTVLFPLTYLDTQQSYYQGTNWVKTISGTFRQTRYGTVTRTVDGYGTLTTPLGTFPNAIRVKTEEIAFDTLQTFFPVTQEIHYTRYAWYAEGEAYLLMQMDSIAVIPFGFPASVSYTHMYRTSEVSRNNTSVFSPVSATHSLRVGPVPTNGRLTLEAGMLSMENTTLEIYGLDGTLILSQNSQPDSQGWIRTTLDLSFLPDGYYHLLLTQQDRTTSYPFIKRS